MSRPEHPMLVAIFEALCRDRWKIDIPRAWRWLDKKEAAPLWFVEGAVKEFEPLLKPSDFLVADEGLTSPADLATLATPMQVESTRKTKVSRAQLDPTSRKHPFVKALVREGITVVEIAKQLGVPRSNVQGWYSVTNPRPIPRAMVTKLQKRFGIDPGVWTNVTE